MLQLHICKELGLTLCELRHRMTDEEILLWSVFFEILNDQQDEAIRQAKRR
jgi:hypothetical protein